MTEEANAEWERQPDGSYVSIPIYARDLDDARAWCADQRVTFRSNSNRRVQFQHHEDVALTTMFWRAEEC